MFAISKSFGFFVNQSSFPTFLNQRGLNSLPINGGVNFHKFAFLESFGAFFMNESNFSVISNQRGLNFPPVVWSVDYHRFLVSSLVYLVQGKQSRSLNRYINRLDFVHSPFTKASASRPLRVWRILSDFSYCLHSILLDITKFLFTRFINHWVHYPLP